MQSSSSRCKMTLHEVNASVLKMIEQKKYPLNPAKLLRIKKSMHKYATSKLKTCPADRYSASFHSSHKLFCQNSTAQLSMGEMLQQEHTRYLMQNKMANSDISQITQKINSCLWKKRKYLLNQQQKDQEKIMIQKEENPKYQKNAFCKNLQSNLNSLVLHLRIKMKEDFFRNRQSISNPVSRFSKPKENDFSPQNIVDLLRGQDQLVNVTRRYPLKMRETVAPHQDIHREFKKDMTVEIRQSLMSDKYCRLRITANHKKIVSIR